MLIVSSIQQNPLLRLLISLIAGIIISDYFNVQQVVLLGFVVIMLISFFVFSSLKVIKDSYSQRWITGVVIMLIWLVFGILSNNKEKYSESIFTNDSIPAKYYGYVSNEPVRYSNGYKFVLNTKAVERDTSIIRSDEKILVYCKDSSLVFYVAYGDEIIIAAQCKPVVNKGNPGEFDYKSYLKTKGILRMCFIDNEDLYKCGGFSGNRLVKSAYNIRDYLLKLYKTYGFREKELGIVSALTLGYRQDLDDETLKSFKDSGAMHIMAVSGLHVGIIQLVMNILFAFLLKMKGGRAMRLIIVVSLLWFYALLTGFSPSVFRATIMFTLIQIGVSMKREIPIYNIIAASGLLFLLINPLQIRDVGFQFSYIAVTGIIYFYPKINSLLIFKNVVVKYIWGLSVTSFCAQLALAPLSIYYFNQFPNYFLLTNIFAIPLAFLIIIGALLLFIVSPVNFIASYVSIILKFLCALLYSITGFVGNLPYSVWSNISLDSISMVLWYSVILSVSGYLIYKRVAILRSFLIILILFVSFGIRNTLNHKSESKIIVMNTDRSDAVYFRAGNDAILVCDSSIFNKRDTDNYYTSKLILEENIKDICYMSTDSLYSFNKGSLMIYDNLTVIKDYKVLTVFDERYRNMSSGSQFSVDLLILGNNVRYDIAELTSLFKINKIVADAFNFNYMIEKWKAQCDSSGIDFCSVKERGAVTIDL